MHWTCSKHESTWDSPLPSKPWQPQAISLLAAGQEQKHGQVPPNHKTCYLTVISCSAKVLMAQMSGNARDWTVQDCRTLSSKALQQRLVSQLGSTGFSLRDSSKCFLWTSEFSSNHICKYCIFLSHVPLQGKSGTCVLRGTTISQQRHCSKPRDFCFIIEVSEKIIQSFRKKLSTDSSSVKWVLLFSPTQSSQPSKLFKWSTWALTSVPGTMGSSCLQDGYLGGTKKDCSRFALLYAWPVWDGIMHVPSGRRVDGACTWQNGEYKHTPRSLDYLWQQIYCKP